MPEAAPPPSTGNPPAGGQGSIADPAGVNTALGPAGEARAGQGADLAHKTGEPPAWLVTASVAGIVIATTLVMIVSFLGPSLGEARIPFAGSGPPFFASAHPGTFLVSYALWIAVVTGAAGVAAGLVAVRRGWRPRPRLLIAGSLIAVVLLMLLPPIGSTDMLNDVIYGRITALGHNPYTMTPRQLMRTGDPVASNAVKKWRRRPSPYGPLTTVTQGAASTLAGDSASATIFWLKIWNALAFLAVALALDRFFRSDAARRARAHLLWTVNPLMLLAVMAGGHNDVLGVVVGLLAVLALRRMELKDGLAAGLLIGLAIAMKAPFALFGLGLAIAALRSPRALAGLGIGAIAVDLPAYWLAGPRSVTTVITETHRANSTYQPWQLVTDVIPHLHRGTAIQALAILATIVLAGLLLWGLPAGPSALPAVRPVLALTLAWLVFSPLQRPWYDVLLFPLLALMPATRLDWIVLGRAVAGAVGSLPGFYPDSPLWLVHSEHLLYGFLVPLTLVCLAATLAWLCLTRQIGIDTTGLSPPPPVPLGRHARVS
jgi:hypothetical protein